MKGLAGCSMGGASFCVLKGGGGAVRVWKVGNGRVVVFWHGMANSCFGAKRSCLALHDLTTTTLT